MKTHTKLVMLGILPLMLVLVLFAGCSNGPASNPASPAAPGPTPTPSFNYGFDVFFGNSGASTIKGPYGVRLSGGTLWVADYSGNNLEAWTTGGNFSRAVTGYNSIAFGGPSADGTGPDGNIYVTDSTNSQVAEFSPTGQYVTIFGHTELGTDWPAGVVVTSTYAFLLDYTAPKVLRYTITGSGNSKTFGSPVTFGTAATSGASGALVAPQNLTTDGNSVYVADAGGSHGVMKYDNSGNFQGAVTATGLAYPVDVELDASGYLYVVDLINHNVQVFNPSGGLVTHFGDNALVGPYGLCLDASGNAYVADYSQNLVVVFRKQ